jgi:hypothetical protein
MNRLRKAATVFALAFMLASSGIAHADNTNDNSNTNNNSEVGGYLGGDSSGSDDSKNWPPTKLDWPPSDISAGGLSGGSGGKGGDSDSSSAKPTPIVMPSGQSAPANEDAAHDGGSGNSASTKPTPIIPAGG